VGKFWREEFFQGNGGKCWEKGINTYQSLFYNGGNEKSINNIINVHLAVVTISNPRS